MKNDLIVNGSYKEFLQCKKDIFVNGLDSRDLNLYLPYFKDIDTVKECFRIYNANRQRKRNNWIEILKWVFAIKYINTFKEYRLIFGTLTFRDKILNNTCERTRARYVTKFLSKETFHYIANIDYGNKNNREHYHFLALIKNNINLKKWTYGSNKVEVVPIDRENIKKTKNYLLKLNNHSYKESTKQKRILKDRNPDKYIDLYAEKYANELFDRFKLEMTSFET